MPLTCIAQQEVGIRRAAAAHHNSDALRQRRSAVGSGSAPPPCGNGGVTAPRIRNGYTDVAARISDGCTGTAADTSDRHVGTAVRGSNGFADSDGFGDFGGHTDYNWDWKGGEKQGTEIKEFRNIYPIPANDINANTNLEQNPEY